MDKYYMLIRQWQNATFRVLARANWSESSVKRFNDMLTAEIGGPMSYVSLLRFNRCRQNSWRLVDNRWKDLKVPTSIAWHLADIWLDELDKVLGTEEVAASVS